MTEIHHAMSDCDTVVELAKRVTIYDAIFNVKDGWDQLPSATIEKCFKSSGYLTACLMPHPFPMSIKLKIKLLHTSLMNLNAGLQIY